MAQPAKRSKAAPLPPSGGRRGRPTLDRVAAIDVAIRDAALGLFLDLGFEAASMDAIALKAGVAKGTLYARYGNKEILFRAILDQELERWSKRAGAQDHLLPDELAPRLRYHARSLAEAYVQPEYARIARLVETAAPTLPNVARHWEEVATTRFLRFLAGDMAKVAGGTGIDWDFYAKLFLFAVSGWLNSGAVSHSDGVEGALGFADRVIGTIELAIQNDAPPRH